ncbi:hypothetical protein [Mycolicibacterium sp. OfavD-34-C]|uniref:hypothetical protein n=1 Tax=Mycolicibacterium sp. OfavD-34-C TaxID=2917746 RepID=UPI001EF4534B|nr:hypothetical protein [Mycolicibacterium sp. OfavD-34-C]MCG7581648.1 hypothetical protein [Mycolicibacterium sp. OfavD-34-C]
MSFSQHWVITPTGPHPINGSVWTVQDMSSLQESISAIGVILCIVFIWLCLLGLLFLLMKDQKLTGYVQVTVQGSGFYHQTFVPVRGPDTFIKVNQMVNYARSLSVVA